jgi:hypothetical protein
MRNEAARMLKQGFNMVLKQFGGAVLIHKDFGSPDQSTREVFGMKNHEKNNRNAVMFQFAEPMDIEIGDVLQLKDARDQWRVTDTEDHIVSGSFINSEARVERLGRVERRPPVQARNQMVFNAPVHGLQVDSPLSSQTVITNQVSPALEAVLGLKRLVEQSSIPHLDREEISLALDRIGELSKREKSADVIAKANEKLEFVKKTLSISKDLANIAAPYLPLLYRAFAG